jgi:hypothetical protein
MYMRFLVRMNRVIWRRGVTLVPNTLNAVPLNYLSEVTTVDVADFDELTIEEEHIWIV